MRVQCDVCEKAEAAVMCCADDAALCAECDVKVHAANKLAIKHQRVPLLKNSEAPRCDICQEKTGYFFCLQDRALLCRNCDVSIHTANALSSCHQRFLVTGIRVALESITAQEPSVGSSEGSLKSATSNISSQITNAPAKGFRAHPSKLNVKDFPGAFVKPAASNAVSRLVSTSSILSAVSSLVSSPMPAATMSSASAMMQMTPHPSLASQLEYGNCYKRSSISEFPTEAMRGWRLDELLNLPDFAGGYILGDIASSKADAVNPGDFDWMADLNLFDEQVCAEAFHEVPELLSLGSLGFPQSGRLMTNAIKGKAKQDMETLSEFEDAFTVPDLGLRSLPESPPFVKRRRL